LSRLDIAEVEAAVRTLLRWAGDDPQAVLSAVHDLPSGAFIVWTLAACALAWAWFNGVRIAKAA
jgi:hypothetical protein